MKAWGEVLEEREKEEMAKEFGGNKGNSGISLGSIYVNLMKQGFFSKVRY